MTLLTGGHYDYIDFSINNYLETGTPASQRHIRIWMKYLSEFVHSLDLVQARPLPNVVKAQPAHTVETVFEDCLVPEENVLVVGNGSERQLQVRYPE